MNLTDGYCVRIVPGGGICPINLICDFSLRARVPVHDGYQASDVNLSDVHSSSY